VLLASGPLLALRHAGLFESRFAEQNDFQKALSLIASSLDLFRIGVYPFVKAGVAADNVFCCPV
jgi:hypothetical protein